MPETMVCPDCGSTQFTAVLTTRTRYTYVVLPDGELYDVASELEDGGDLDEISELECEGCSGDFDPSELVTQETYDA